MFWKINQFRISVWDGFILDSHQLIPTGRETWAGIKVVIEAVLKLKRGIFAVNQIFALYSYHSVGLLTECCRLAKVPATEVTCRVAYKYCDKP